MTDRKLLELAAKSAGIEIKHWIGSEPFSPHWNPLTDDGDALRLAVKLMFFIDIDLHLTEVVNDYGNPIHEPHNSDPYAATRRAIVRAAAAIGEKP